jgi:hypothetical protein
MTGPQINGPPRSSGKSVALWSAVATLFTSIASINVLALLGEEGSPWLQIAAAFVTALASAGAVYAKVRLDDEKTRPPPSA